MKLRKHEELVAGRRINEVVAGRIHRELAGLRALAAMVAAGLIMGLCWQGHHFPEVRRFAVSDLGRGHGVK